MYSANFSWKGWKLGSFLKGRKELIVAIVGYIGGYVVTNNPMTAGIVAAATELVYAIIEYFCKTQA